MLSHTSNSVSSQSKTSADMRESSFWGEFLDATRLALSEALAAGVQSDVNNNPKLPRKTPLSKKADTQPLRDYIIGAAFLHEHLKPTQRNAVQVSEQSCYDSSSYEPVVNFIQAIEPIESLSCENEKQFVDYLKKIKEDYNVANFPLTLKVRLEVLITSIQNIQTKVFSQWWKSTSADTETAIQMALINLVKERNKNEENDTRLRADTMSSLSSGSLSPSSVNTSLPSSHLAIASNAPVDNSEAIRQEKIAPHVAAINSAIASSFSESERAGVNRYIRILQGFGAHDQRVDALKKIIDHFSRIRFSQNLEKKNALAALELSKKALENRWTIQRYQSQKTNHSEIEGAVNTPEELKVLHKAMESDVQSSLKTLYDLAPNAELGEAEVKRKFWFHLFGKTNKQLAIEQYIAAENKSTSATQEAAKKEFSHIIDACSMQSSKKKACLDVCERVKAIEAGISKAGLDLSKAWNEQYLKNIRNALEQLYPDAQGGATASARLATSESNNLLQRIKTATTYWGVFGGTWSTEYKTAKGLIDALDRLPVDKNEITTKGNAFISLCRKKKSLMENANQNSHLCQLEASVGNTGDTTFATLMKQQETRIADEIENIKQDVANYVDGTGVPKINVIDTEHCDFLIQQMYLNRTEKSPVSYSERKVILSSDNQHKNTEVDYLREALLRLFEGGNPNVYFVLLLLGIELARLEAISSDIAYRPVLRRLMLNLFKNSSAYTVDLAELKNCANTKWLTAFLPATFSLSINEESKSQFDAVQRALDSIDPYWKSMPTNASSSPKTVIVSSWGSSSSVISPEKIQKALTVNSTADEIDNVCVSDQEHKKLKELAGQHAQKIAPRKGVSLLGRYSELLVSLEYNLATYSNARKSVILAYTLCQWYATTARGKKLLSAYTQDQKSHKTVCDCLKNLMTGDKAEVSLQVLEPFKPYYDPTNKQEPVNKSLGDLFDAIAKIFPQLFKKSAQTNLSSNSSMFWSTACSSQQAADHHKPGH